MVNVRMTTVAVLCLLLLERFLASDLDMFTEPVLRGLRVLEKAALRVSQNVVPSDILTRGKKLARFFLFTTDTPDEGVQLKLEGRSGFSHFRPNRETKIIIHGFMDNVKIAEWMHDMKDEFLLLDNFNVIIVDWSQGNSIPYTQAAANTERAGQEVAQLVRTLVGKYGSHPGKFHLLGHSLGSHVAGHAGEKVRGLQRITGLDPATHLFTPASERSKLDKTDANFVDVIHTDGGGIGMAEPVGHVDFYPNGGEVQPGCTPSNSIRLVFEKGVVEGVRSVICSHMRATYLFTDTINSGRCQMLGFRCADSEAFEAGQCDSCGGDGKGCALMGYHVDRRRDYRNGSKFFLLTAKDNPFCGQEYKISLQRSKEPRSWSNALRRRSGEWASDDVLTIILQGSKGSAEFKLEGKDKKPLTPTHVVFSQFDLGQVHTAVLRWTKRPEPTSKKILQVLSSVVGSREISHPVVERLQVKQLKPNQARGNGRVFQLCLVPKLARGQEVEDGITYRSEYCRLASTQGSDRY